MTHICPIQGNKIANKCPVDTCMWNIAGSCLHGIRDENVLSKKRGIQLKDYRKERAESVTRVMNILLLDNYRQHVAQDCPTELPSGGISRNKVIAFLDRMILLPQLKATGWDRVSLLAAVTRRRWTAFLDTLSLDYDPELRGVLGLTAKQYNLVLKARKIIYTYA